MEEELSGAGISNLFAVAGGVNVAASRFLFLHEEWSGHACSSTRLRIDIDESRLETYELHLPLKCFAGFVC